MDEAIDGLTDLVSWGGDLSSTSYDVGNSIAVAILVLGLIPAVWAIGNKKDNAKTYVISWFVLVIFTIIFILN